MKLFRMHNHQCRLVVIAVAGIHPTVQVYDHYNFIIHLVWRRLMVKTIDHS